MAEGRYLQTRFLGGNRVRKLILDTALLFLPRKIGRHVVVQLFGVEQRFVRAAL
jgi:hypothetical protein